MYVYYVQVKSDKYRNNDSLAVVKYSFKTGADTNQFTLKSVLALTVNKKSFFNHIRVILVTIYLFRYSNLIYQNISIFIKSHR